MCCTCLLTSGGAKISKTGIQNNRLSVWLPTSLKRSRAFFELEGAHIKSQGHFSGGPGGHMLSRPLVPPLLLTSVFIFFCYRLGFHPNWANISLTYPLNCALGGGQFPSNINQGDLSLELCPRWGSIPFKHQLGLFL